MPSARDAKSWQAAGIGIEQGPLQDAGYAARISAGCEAVIHLAAAQHEANVPDEYFFDVNVNGTRTLIEASKRAGVERFVYGSTIGVYGEYAASRWMRTTPPRPLERLWAQQTRRRGDGQVRPRRLADEHRAHFRDLRAGRLSPAQTVPRARSRALPHHRFRAESAPGHSRATTWCGDSCSPRRIPRRSGETFVMAGRGDDDDARDGGARGACSRTHGARAGTCRYGRSSRPRWSWRRPCRRSGFSRRCTAGDWTSFASRSCFPPPKQGGCSASRRRCPFAAGAVETAAWYREQGYLSR